MLEKITYINHKGERLDFGTGSLFAKENKLRDYAWEIAQKNNKITSFSKGVASKAIPLIMKVQSDSDGILLRNKVFEIFEKDVIAKEYGRFVIGDYYLKCYVTGLAKSEYLVTKQYIAFEVTLQTDRPEWIKETVLAVRNTETINSAFLDFNYDFNYDYLTDFSVREINNSSLQPCNFKIVVYGGAIKPAIFIGNHKYSVNVEILNDEYLTINSMDKTIILTKANGETVNCFNLRNKENYIFEKIPIGINAASSENGCIFDVVLFEERSEPKWT